LYNPFAKTKASPKIADGREFLSAGIRLQSVKEITCSSDANNPTMIALFPGLSNAVWIINAGSEGIPMPFNNHLKGTTTAQEPTTKIAKWRLVSCGLRLQLLNNSDENEGWFECIRYQVYPKSTEALAITPKDGLLVIEGPSNTALPGYDAGGGAPNLCEHPTYQSGKLRHLNRMIFKLLANTGDHEFINVDNAVKTEQLMDPSFDCLLFKIHGRSPVGTGAQPTKLLIHSISNQEIVYDESSTLSRYMNANKLSNRAAVTTKAVGSGFTGAGM